MKKATAQKLKIGDKVERIAKPAARAIDKFMETDLSHCLACMEMKRMLNDGRLLEAVKARLWKS